MSDMFQGNKSGVSYGSQYDALGASFGRIAPQDKQSIGSNNGGGSFAQVSVSFLVQPDQYRSSVGLEEGGPQIQIFEYQEPQNQKGILFRSSGDFEMQFEEIRMDRLNIDQQQKVEEDAQQQEKFNQRASNEFEMKIQCAEQISTNFKPEIYQMVNPNIIEENKNLFNVNISKSIYTNKITQLVEQTQLKLNQQNRNQTPTHLSKSQQKLQRKSPNLQRDHSDFSSDFNQQNSNDPNQDPVQQKLAKNRESARNSRARKKIYYELLEVKAQELQNEVDSLKQQIQNQQKYTEICNKSQEKFQMFLEQQQLLFDKLETYIIKNKDNMEIGMILDALRYRTNSNSQERNDAARNHFDQMVEVCLPIQTRYLIYALEKNKDFFAQQPNDYSDWMIDSFQKTDIKPEQIVKVKKMKTKLQSVRNNISDSIHKIKEQLKLIQCEALKVDQMWEQLKECLTPIQLGSCILAMRQNQYRQELQTSSLFLQLKNSQMSDEDEVQGNQEQFTVPNNRKLIKKSQN
ncbi:unnamed protein product [Paramecium primaurelia]|uniref:BZIP domain-containing protein n=1 Tax=Paramecium primaurelia TaxID=5886 RepID=A0A8S1KJ41_PARPR|nr:unnamed protein product [Paramecium primaurelia]